MSAPSGMMSLQAAIDQVGLGPVKARTGGAGRRIGLVDGAVDWTASGLAASRGRQVSGQRLCEGCRPTTHGTFMATLLSGSSGLCPEASLDSVPVFGAERTASTSGAVAEAVASLLDAGVDVINISLGIAGGGIVPHPVYIAVCARAERQGVPMVVAAGNQARVGPAPLAVHPWVIPVAACLEDGRPHPMSNLGPSIGARGFMAPGWPLGRLRHSRRHQPGRRICHRGHCAADVGPAAPIGHGCARGLADGQPAPLLHRAAAARRRSSLSAARALIIYQCVPQAARRFLVRKMLAARNWGRVKGYYEPMRVYVLRPEPRPGELPLLFDPDQVRIGQFDRRRLQGYDFCFGGAPRLAWRSSPATSSSPSSATRSTGSSPAITTPTGT
jgi:hypothetical protein